MKKVQTEIVVLGGGPGGYAAAFYAADLGKKVILIEKDKLGGVCLNRGCIPSKALLHATHLISAAEEAKEMGIHFTKPKIDIDTLRAWKDNTISKLNSGVAGLAKKRGVEVIKGRGILEGSQELRVETEKGQQVIQYEKLILAVGSKPALPNAFNLGSKRIMTSTEALQIEDIPKKLLVVGGGYIGMELGTVYSILGSSVDMVEAMPQILTGADTDLVRPVKKFAEKHFNQTLTNAKVMKMATKSKQIEVELEIDGKKVKELYDKVLVSVGRTPNTYDLGLENTGVTLDDKGFVKVNGQQQTDDPNILAIGDIAGGALLAHKASKEARIAVEAINGEPSSMNDVQIPAVVYTHPEVAWCGLTETEAKEKKIKVNVAKFGWGASGRAMSMNATDGITKLILEPETDRVLGVGIAGENAGELIAEGLLAVEMAATAEDIALTVHPHPTLNETVMEAAEVYYGHSTHSK